MLRLKTPSVGKLFNYLRYCGGAGAGEIRRSTETPREKEAKRAGVGWVETGGRRSALPRREKRRRSKRLVAKPILIYVASELEFVNFHESPGLVKGI